MDIKKNTSLVNRIYKAFNNREIDLVDELFTNNFIDHTASSDQVPGGDGIKDAWNQIWDQFPEIKIIINDIINEDNKVVCRITFQNGDKPIGHMIEIFYICEEKVKELWNIIKLK